MEIVAFVKGLREKGIAVKLAGDQLEVLMLKDGVDADTIALLKQHKQEVIAYLSSITRTHSFKDIPRVAVAASYAVSNAQLRLWLESQSAAASIAYHIPFQLVLHGEYDTACLQAAVNYVVDRHEILRTVFRLDDQHELRQYILPRADMRFEVPCLDYSNDTAPLEAIRNYIIQDHSLLFSLEEGPLIRAAILQAAPDHYVFYCNMHHIICDAWSIPVLKKEILAAYNAIKADQSPDLPPLEIQYKDYAAWYQQQLRERALLQQQAYWLSQLSGELPVLDFPTRQTRPPVKTYNGATLKTFIGPDVSAQLKTYARNNNGSLFMVVLSALHVILSRYTGADDIIIGSPFAAREHISLKDQVGFYTNTLALRNTLEAGDSFDDFFRKVWKTVLDAHANQQYPFEQLVKDLRIKKDTSRNPLFDVMLVVSNSDQAAERTVAPEDIDRIVADTGGSSKFDMLIYVEELNDLLTFRVEYNTDLYEATLIRQFMEHFKLLLNRILASPSTPLSAINYLSAAESVIRSAIDASAYRKEGVIRYFEEQVLKTPEQIALQFEEQTYTYRAVNEQANQLAHCLRQQYKVLPQAKVGVLLGRSHLNVVAMTGIMKSGACYVPIDHKYQEDRIKYILEDAGIQLIVSTTALLPPGTAAAYNVLYLDTFEGAAWTAANPGPVNVPDDPSFVIYTSGSTGKPKGVVQTHRMLNNLIQWNIHHSGIDSGLRLLQYNSFSFDVSVQDCWFTLCSGGTLFITPEHLKADFALLSAYIVEHAIAILSFPFSALSSFFDALTPAFIADNKIQHILSSGEQLTLNRNLEAFLRQLPHVKLHNHYGPSETHVVTSYTMSSGAQELLSYVPIGKPLPNTHICLLDKHLQPVPPMVTGEVYVGGEHLAAGYLNLPELTAERFVYHQQERLYKTGDLACLDYTGNLVYLGRNDDQVKLRGYRIELSEIKHVLLSQEGISQAYVDVVKQHGESVLAAYVVSIATIDRQALRKRLAKALPDYMVPAYLVEVDALPLNSNGKTDKSRLPAIGNHLLSSNAYVPPATTVEKQLVLIWEEILKRGNIGITDNFFELGGHSLHITRMLYRINSVFDIKLQMKAVFAAQHIQELAQAVEEEIVFRRGILANPENTILNEKNSEIWEI
ncbi:amino acid adenylation domain-containing protein [uncultured Chitinophaga sp.]|jgi:amino acid adenylation domain|uniref:non-ribosomal peptide synthetase n=1 Tax=uncultured Chitinophaga sp. TaxID=339340 RepID=UPI002615A452|nr:amino acid adenylation domain-containing protein [uncultured Chitinophaga sp.]